MGSGYRLRDEVSKIEVALLLAWLAVCLVGTPVAIYDYFANRKPTTQLEEKSSSTRRQLEQINEELDQIQRVKNRYIMEYSEMKIHGQLIPSSGEEYGYFSSGNPRFPQQRLSVSNYMGELSRLKSQEDKLRGKKISSK